MGGYNRGKYTEDGIDTELDRIEDQFCSVQGVPCAAAHGGRNSTVAAVRLILTMKNHVCYSVGLPTGFRTTRHTDANSQVFAQPMPRNSIFSSRNKFFCDPFLSVSPQQAETKNRTKFHRRNCVIQVMTQTSECKPTMFNGQVPVMSKDSGEGPHSVCAMLSIRFSFSPALRVMRRRR